ncbi:MAG: ABC transporter ATP-binding protein [Candidatus Aerophobetes bacterium]|nr:ABC transporter ATP-binding protein [Candidatus Aerophobetes bacterium]
MKLKIQELNFRYDSRLVLKEIGLEVEEGEILTLVGPNGSGKTTLLRCIMGILNPERGYILIDGKLISKIKRKELARRIAYVPQSEPTSFPTTVFDTILMGRKPYLNWNPSVKDFRIVSEALHLLGLKEFALRDLNELSGGEKQKVLIARAIVQEPETMLLDEPTSNLDLKHQLEILEIVKNLVKEKAISVIMAMHDLNLASRYSDKLVMLKNGKIFGIGIPKQVITSENMKSVYGVEAVIYNQSRTPYVVAKNPLKEL